MVSINLLLAVAACVATFTTTFGNTTDAGGKINGKGIFALLIAIAVLVISSFKAYDDEKKDDDKDRLNKSMKIAIDSSSRIIDSLKLLTINVNSAISTENRRLFYDKLNFEVYGNYPVKYNLVKGMTLKIVRENCEGSLSFQYHGKRVLITALKHDIPINESISGGEAVFSNEGDNTCSLSYEIFGTLQMQQQSADMQDSLRNVGIRTLESFDKEDPQIPKKTLPDNLKSQKGSIATNNLAPKSIDKEQIKYYVSIGVYKNQDNGNFLRSSFKLNSNEKITTMKYDGNYIYLLSDGTQSFHENLLRVRRLKQVNKDCFVVSITEKDNNKTLQKYPDVE